MIVVLNQNDRRSTWLLSINGRLFSTKITVIPKLPSFKNDRYSKIEALDVRDNP